MPLPRLTSAAIATLKEREEREVDIPEWGFSVVVRGLTSQQINRASRNAEDAQRGGELNLNKRNAWYIVEGVVDPKIEFKVAERWITETSYGPVSKVLIAILEESGLTERSTEDAKSTVPEEPAPSV